MTAPAPRFCSRVRECCHGATARNPSRIALARQQHPQIVPAGDFLCQRALYQTQVEHRRSPASLIVQNA